MLYVLSWLYPCVTVNGVSLASINGSESRYAGLMRSIETVMFLLVDNEVLVVASNDRKRAIVWRLQYRFRSIVSDKYMIGHLQVLEDEWTSFSMAGRSGSLSKRRRNSFTKLALSSEFFVG